ncbi:hypothetical protein E8E13_002270 [Curvularia kusanoi]|uniref:AA1-like domain-containing protein n=1 Tax=Curvularia kusanoi TaxID=90978 RepID=A0A9P4THW1_CURKU|nr:hypothetical protein E8E13_002270 [Curvularia kusanoi]
MKFAIAALFAGIAAAAPAAAADPYETVTIYNFVYVGVNGYPQISYHIRSQLVDGVHCAADHIEIGGVYSCDDPSYTFKVIEERGRKLTLTHTLNGSAWAGDFMVRMNGPLPTVLDQIGTSTADLDKEVSA